MTALACLRILPVADTPSTVTGPPSLSARRSAATFLVSRWSRPRRFGEIAPGVFLLSDPGSGKVDEIMLAELAAQLTHEGAQLVVLEGGQDAATVFAALYPADLRSVLAGVLTVEGMPGQVSLARPDGLFPVKPAEDRVPLRLIVETNPSTRGEDQRSPLRATG